MSGRSKRGDLAEAGKRRVSLMLVSKSIVDGTKSICRTGHIETLCICSSRLSRERESSEKEERMFQLSVVQAHPRMLHRLHVQLRKP